MKNILSIFGAFAITLFAASTVFAAGQSNCQVVYGGGEVCEEQVKFTINKLVQHPGKGGAYVENLTVNDPKYAPNQNVNFKIEVVNTGDKTIENLNVTDTFPEILSFVAGVGNAEVGSKSVNFVIGKLEKGKKVEYIITAKTANADKLNATQCANNNVKAVATTGAVAEDNAQICVEKPVVPTTTVVNGKPEIMDKPNVKTIPSTGPEMVALFGLIPTGIAGIYFRRKA